MSNSPNIKCPKCLQTVNVRTDQAGDRIDCPGCGSSLVVPDSVAVESVFDDLFDEPQDAADTTSQNDKLHDNSDDASASDSGADDHAETVSEERDISGSLEEAATTFGDQAVLDTGWIDDLNKISAAGGSEPDDPRSEPERESDREAARNAETIEHNPFDYDETKSLRVEGISPDVSFNEGFYVKCSVCDSELHATEQQIGHLVKCTDCLSEIRIVKPKKRQFKDNWRQPAKMKTQDSDEELTLEPPVEKPKDAMIGEGFGLEDVAGDLLSPIVEPEVVESKPAPRPKKRTKNQQPSRNPDAAQAAQSERPKQQAGNTRKRRPERIAKSKKPKPVELSQLAELELATDIDLMIRTLVVVIFLSFGYVMADSVWETWMRDDLNGGEKFGTILPAGIGVFVCLATAAWMLSITISVLMRSIANGYKKVDEWVGFAPSEWMGSFVAVAFGIWASSLPGAVLGYLIWKLTDVFILLPLTLAGSCFLLMPVFLISSFHNESAINIFSGPVITTLSDRTDLWSKSFQFFALCLGGFILGTLILMIPGLLFCFVGATIQVAAVTFFAILLGLHARAIVDQI